MTDEQLEPAAFQAFCRNMAEYELEPGNLQLAFYGEVGVRDFWVKEAREWWASFNAVQIMEGVTQHERYRTG